MATSKWQEKQEILASNNGQCFYCGKDLTKEKEWHRDHFKARALGGRWKGNLVPACVQCNTRKSCYTPEQFKAWIKLHAIKRLRPILFDETERLTPFLDGETASRLEALVDSLCELLDEMDLHFYYEKG